MGTNERTSSAWSIGGAWETAAREPAETPACAFCGQRLCHESENGPERERVEHVIPVGDGTDTRTATYCSPSCFIREMQQIAGTDTLG